jgi:capsular exopolysaccharide synthesis family protein
MDDGNRTDGLNLQELLHMLRRRLGIIVLASVLVPLSALVFSLLQEKQYTASAALLFRDPRLSESVFEAPVARPYTDPDREAQTNLELVSLDVVADRTAGRVRGLSGEDVTEMVEVTSEGQSDVVSIEATTPDPSRSARVANTFAAQYLAFRREADRSKVRDAQVLIERKLANLPRSQRNGEEGHSLEDRAEQLEVLRALQTGNAELVERAEPPSEPSSPEPVRNTVIGGALGILLGLGLALLLERLDRRVKDPREFEAIFARPLVGTLRESRSLSADANSPERLPPEDAEAFRMLRANLRYFNVDHDNRSIVITSPGSGEGKSTVAWNLASAAAEAGGRVLLIEADLRRPSLAERHRLSAGQGLSGVLAGQANLDGAAHTIPLDQPTSTGSQASFDVLLAGPLPPNPSDLIESAQMARLLQSAERRYDTVVIDTPPATVVSDTAPLLKQVSGVLVVSRLGQTTRDSARHLHHHLEHLGAPTLGVVVNGVSARGGYYGGYEYMRGGYAETASPLGTRSDHADEAPSRARADRPEESRPTPEGSRSAPEESHPAPAVSRPAAVTEEAPATQARQPVPAAAAPVNGRGGPSAEDSISDGRAAARPSARRARTRLRRVLRG